MLPPCSSSLVSSSHSYDETITNRHPRNDAAACLEPTLAARSTCATKDVTRWFSRWWSGSIVSTPTPQGCCGSLYTVYIQKPSVLWRSPLLLQINLRRPDSCGVSDGLPPTRLASSRHNRRLSDDILFHRSSVVSRYRLLWRNRCQPVSQSPL